MFLTTSSDKHGVTDEVRNLKTVNVMRFCLGKAIIYLSEKPKELREKSLPLLFSPQRILHDVIRV
jgi:hypothetical protein